MSLVRFFSGRANVSTGRHGFTLIELLIVLAILSLLCCSVGIGLLRGMPERRMMGAVREIYCGLRQAQSRAVSQGDRITVSFNPGSDAFSLIGADGRVLSSTSLPGCIDLYEITGDTEEENHYFFNSRGIKTGVSGSVQIRYQKPGYDQRRVVVRATGAMSIQRSSDNGENWE